MSTHRLTLELEREAFIRLPDLPRARISCLSGVVWITRDGDRNDVVLQPGGTYEFRKGTTVQALHASRIAIEAPQALQGPESRLLDHLRGLPKPA